MVLSRSILKEFSDATKQKAPQGTTYLRGTIQGKGETKYVKIDGSESLTPINEVVDAKDGDRVLITIQNHVATVLGNLTKPPSAYKTQEAMNKASEANTKASTAIQDASTAQRLARDAKADAGQAIIDAGEAGTIAKAAKKEAQEAIGAASEVSKNLGSTLEAARIASETSNAAIEKAIAAERNVSNVNNELDKIKKVAEKSVENIKKAKRELQEQFDTYKEEVKGTYQTKKGMDDIKLEMSDSVTKKLGEWETTMSQTYASKNDITSIEGSFNTLKRETAESTETIRQSWETFKSDTTTAKEQVDQALENARSSQEAAKQAKDAAEQAKKDALAAQANAKTSADKAVAAQELADAAASTAKSADANLAQARTELNEAINNYAAVKKKMDATAQEIADAKSTVENAKKKVDEANRLVAEAQTASSKANTAANTAKQEAETAKSAAQGAETRARNAETAANNAAQSARDAQAEVAKYTKRVTEYEKKIEDSDKKTAEYYRKTTEIGDKIANISAGAKNYASSNYIQKLGNTPNYNYDATTGRGHFTAKATGWNGHGICFTNRSPILLEGETLFIGLDVTPNKDCTGAFDINNSLTVGGPDRGNDNDDSSLRRFSFPNNSYYGRLKAGVTVRVWCMFTAKTGTNLVNVNSCFSVYSDPNITVEVDFQNVTIMKTNVPMAYTFPEDDIKNNYYSKVELKTQFERKAGEVYTAVSRNVTEEIQEGEKRIKKDVKNFNFGGRNILRGTTDMIIGNGGWKSGHWRLSGSGTIKTVDVADSPVKGVSKGILATPNAGTKVGPCQDGYSLQIPGTYTLSVWVKGQKGARVIIQTYWNQGIASPKMKENNYTLKSNDWERVSITGEVEKYTNITLAYLFAFDKPATFIAPYMDNSDVINNWSPAKEDMATYQEAKDAKDAADTANGKADDLTTRIEGAESIIDQLSDAIVKMVTDKNGTSLMTQTSTGWTFNMGTYKDQISEALGKLTTAEGKLTAAEQRLNNFDRLTKDLNNKTAYINVTTNEKKQPVLELGKAGDAFKIRISNTSVDYMDGSTRVAYVSNRQLFIETATVKNELKIGEPDGFIWKKRANGNLGLRWTGG